MSQSGYIRDLLRQQGVTESTQGLTVPCAREWLQDEDTEDEKKTPEEFLVKAAQKATGETLWLSTRSRPELASVEPTTAGFGDPQEGDALPGPDSGIWPVLLSRSSRANAYGLL